MPIRVLVWNENQHEKSNALVRRLYPDGIHGAVAKAFAGAADISVETATLDDPEHGLSEDFPDRMVMTVTFEPADGGKKTKLTVTQSIPLSVAERNGALIGWGQTLDHLVEHLKSM